MSQLFLFSFVQFNLHENRQLILIYYFIYHIMFLHQIIFKIYFCYSVGDIYLIHDLIIYQRRHMLNKRFIFLAI